MRKTKGRMFKKTDGYEGGNKIHEDGQQLCSQQCSEYKVWSGIGYLCQTSTSGAELERKLDAKENRSPRMGRGLVVERNDRSQWRTSVQST